MEARFNAMADVRHLACLPRDSGGRLDPRLLDASAAIDALERLESLTAHLHAMQAELLVAAAGAEPTADEFAVEPSTTSPPAGGRLTVCIVDASRDEIAAALRWSGSFTSTRIAQARLLCGHLPATLSALRDGEISPRHAIVIAEAAARFSYRDARNDEGRAAFAAACTALEARVLPTARCSTVARTVSVGRRAVARIDTDHRRRQASAQRGRDVTMFQEEDGIACVLARLSAPAAHALIDAVRQHSLSIDDSSLTAGERRAQALMSLVFGEVAPEVRLNVVMSQDTESLDWVASLRDSDVAPGMLRELMADPNVAVTLRRLATNELTGQVSGVGRDSYRLPARLRDFLTWRDQTCRFPGCGRRAEHCQFDHAVAWDAGGSTDAANLGALCVRHHQLKTHGGWRITASDPDGSCSWQSPQGRRYRRHTPAVRGVPLEARLARVLATTREQPSHSPPSDIALGETNMPFHAQHAPPF